jgi:Flp pilus assembly protein TadG
MTALHRIAARLRRIGAERRGNVLMIFAFAMIPMVFATGMGIDYTRAERLQTKLDAVADAAALSAVTQTMMRQTNATACQTARNMFKSQAAGLSGLIIDMDDPQQLSVTLKDNSGTIDCDSSDASLNTSASFARTVTVAYSGRSKNSFGGILGMSTLPVHGTSQAYSAVAPNIDFYVMLDTSPSMLLPATTTGLKTLTTATGGCAFACHQSNLVYSIKDSSKGIPGNTELVCADKTYHKNCVDYYTVARNNNIALRTDVLTLAVQDLTSVATTTATQNKAKYRMGLLDFDYTSRQIWPTTKSSDGFWVDADLGRVETHVPDAKVLVYSENNDRVYNVSDNDKATNFTTAFNKALNTMPKLAGNGTNVSGDTPQAILFVITDGMRDEDVSGARKMGPIPTSQCKTIKDRGIRIAILYTEYLPESASDDWSKTNVKAPYLVPDDKISPPLIECASPGLYYKVTTDDDISAALTKLFETAVATARLTQ